MAIVDPNKSGGQFRSCGKGQKVLACVGLDKRKNQKNNMQYEVHYVCVKDLSAPAGQDGDKGADHWDRFVLTENALWRLGAAAKAFGHTAPFDSDDKAAIAEIFSNGYVVANVISRYWDGEERFETKSWSVFDGQPEEDWDEVIAKGEEGHKKLIEGRKKGAGGGGGGSGGGSAPKPARRAAGDEEPGSGFAAPPDEIPF